MSTTPPHNFPFLPNDSILISIEKHNSQRLSSYNQIGSACTWRHSSEGNFGSIFSQDLPSFLFLPFFKSLSINSYLVLTVQWLCKHTQPQVHRVLLSEATMLRNSEFESQSGHCISHPIQFYSLFSHFSVYFNGPFLCIKIGKESIPLLLY